MIYSDPASNCYLQRIGFLTQKIYVLVPAAKETYRTISFSPVRKNHE